ncbi:DUF3006 domain-containing protein [Mycoplasmatota bacterium]|nr:DUF3006 domain-containing protein [Mycoplasmatota bacterium]
MAEEKKYCIVDRFEKNYAVIEFEKETFNIPKVLLPSEVKEGDIIDITITINDKKTEDRKKRIEDLSKKLFKN